MGYKRGFTVTSYLGKSTFMRSSLFLKQQCSQRDGDNHEKTLMDAKTSTGAFKRKIHSQTRNVNSTASQITDTFSSTATDGHFAVCTSYG
ncbi:hypothetical protein GDO86_018875 [Hymenochirus boettgeri]|uniref:Uncharacterized protein n=1 Tax=Hymenochirus boettgeri TaxID=247094 RepID=A0A8T2IFH0_9PIPI|nr:hypothetical protein GDO86_018875 [Hymenochirus boettgeri]